MRRTFCMALGHRVAHDILRFFLDIQAHAITQPPLPRRPFTYFVPSIMHHLEQEKMVSEGQCCKTRVTASSRSDSSQVESRRRRCLEAKTSLSSHIVESGRPIRCSTANSYVFSSPQIAVSRSHHLTLAVVVTAEND